MAQTVGKSYPNGQMNPDQLCIFKDTVTVPRITWQQNSGTERPYSKTNSKCEDQSLLLILHSLQSVQMPLVPGREGGRNGELGSSTSSNLETSQGKGLVCCLETASVQDFHLIIPILAKTHLHHPPGPNSPSEEAVIPSIQSKLSLSWYLLITSSS